MDCGVPILNCLIQQTLRSICSCSHYSSNSASSKWVYAIFWRIVPRYFPPPKWEFGGSVLDRSNGNKRNWILVWEDGFCDFYECERGGNGYNKGSFGADLFFKMSHEVYNYGEGLVGKVAADNSHKWVFRDNPNETDLTLIPSWNASIEPQPRAWESHFRSGIQTIAIIAVKEGIVQLGSFDKIPEDLNLIINVQRKFSYLQSIPGMFAIQRPYLVQNQHQYVLKPNVPTIEIHKPADFSVYDKQPSTGVKRLFNEIPDGYNSPTKCMNLGWNTPQNSISSISGSSIWQIPPLLPCGKALLNSTHIKVESSCYLDAAPEEKPSSVNAAVEFEDGEGKRQDQSRV